MLKLNAQDIGHKTMAVLEHDIHPSTQHGADRRYGCHNRDWSKAKGYYADSKERRADGTYFDVQVLIPHRMSTSCRYDLSNVDVCCNGCEHVGQGEAYDKMVRERGS